MMLPLNSTDKAVVLLTNINPMKTILDRVEQKKTKIFKLNPQWLNFEQKNRLYKRWNRVKEDYEKYLKEHPKINEYETFKSKEYAIGKNKQETLLKGKTICQQIYKKVSGKWDYLMPLYNLMHRPLWFNKKKPLLCKICKKQWGTKHIKECTLLQQYMEIWNKWSRLGFYDIQYYFNESQLEQDIERLKKMIGTIKENAIEISINSEHSHKE